jgi:hypothetical protein
MPTCRLDETACDRLWKATNHEIGADFISAPGALGAPPPWVCPHIRRCKVQIDEVVMIYWPDNVVSRNICALQSNGSSSTIPWTPRGSIFTTDAITFRGQDVYIRSIDGVPIDQYFVRSKTRWDFRSLADRVKTPYLTGTTITGPFTFTSPTVYVAHPEIIRQEIFGTNGNLLVLGLDTVVRGPGIISMHRTDVSSVRPKLDPEYGKNMSYAQAMAKGEYDPTIPLLRWATNYETLPFDFGNLIDPVPASAYYDARHFDCLGRQTHCGTITDDTYRPNLRIARSIWASVYSDFICDDPLVVDPPIALKPLDSSGLGADPSTRSQVNQPKPTLPVASEQEGIWHESAQPGQRPESPHPAVTPPAFGPLRDPWSVNPQQWRPSGPINKGRPRPNQPSASRLDPPAIVDGLWPLSSYWLWKPNVNSISLDPRPYSDSQETNQENGRTARGRWKQKGDHL